MTATVEFEQETGFIAAFESAHVEQSLPEAEDEAALVAVYQQIADRRAQVENAEILRRARAL
jgi:hypothetical protein